jgi:hypothetical protein
MGQAQKVLLLSDRKRHGLLRFGDRVDAIGRGFATMLLRSPA